MSRKPARLGICLFGFGLVGALGACGSAATSGSGSAAGSAGAAKQTGTGGSTTAVAGATNATAGSPSSVAGSDAGGALGISGSASGGGSLAAGGAASGGVGNGGSHSGGSSGEGAASGSSSGGSTDDVAAAAPLNHYQLLDPCQSSYKAVATPGDVCSQDNAVKNQHDLVTFGGDPAITYKVTVRVRGIMEGYWYTGGTLDPVSKTFYTGGVPTIGGYSSACKNLTSSLGLSFTLPAEVTPSDNCWNGFNMFGLIVSEPKQVYYLNYTAERNSDRPPHAVYESDYTVTIPIKGGAKLDFYIIGSDEHECYNFDKVVSGVNTTPSPYIGNFTQFDVVNVTRAN